MVTIKAGGFVNFIIAGFHHILIYGNGTKPADINRAATMPVSVPPGPPLINDPMESGLPGPRPQRVSTAAGYAADGAAGLG